MDDDIYGTGTVFNEHQDTFMVHHVPYNPSEYADILLESIYDQYESMEIDGEIPEVGSRVAWMWTMIQECKVQEEQSSSKTQDVTDTERSNRIRKPSKCQSCGETMLSKHTFLCYKCNKYYCEVCASQCTNMKCHRSV